MRVEKEFVGKIPVTRLALTRLGRAGIEQHWQRLEALCRHTLVWHPEA